MYIGYQRLYNLCKICVAKRSAKHCQANTEQTIAKPIIYRLNNKENINHVRKTHNQQIEERNNKIENLTQAMQMLTTTISVALKLLISTI